MNKLKKYVELDSKIKKLEELKKELKGEIVQEIKELDGKNKDKELVIDNYIASVTYAKKTTWDVELAESFFIRHNHKECLSTKVDNKIVTQLENKEIFDKKSLDGLRKVAWDSPRLFVKSC